MWIVILLIYHKPVFLNFILEHLKNGEKQTILDATLGEGGHSLPCLERGHRVYGLERDQEILARGALRLKAFEERFTGVLGNFADLGKLFAPKIKFDLIIMDLGISKFHYFASKRGFSFLQDEFLDMRLDSPGKGGLTAYEVINSYQERELANIFINYGEEPFFLAKRCARNIVQGRAIKPIKTTGELRELIKKSYLSKVKKIKINPATKIFQALRIYVNDELNVLEKGIGAALEQLAAGGVLLIISYHSLEDRIVKRLFKESSEKKENHNKYRPPVKKSALSAFRLVNQKAITPTAEEIKLNPAARSAKLRGIVKGAS